MWNVTVQTIIKSHVTSNHCVELVIDTDYTFAKMSHTFQQFDCLLSLFGKDQPTRPKSPQKNNNSHTLIRFSSLPAHVDMETPAQSLVGNQDEYQSL